MELFKDIEKWHEERGLAEPESLDPQVVKVMEEVGELAKAVSHNQFGYAAYAIGDSIIALIGVATALGFDSLRCLDMAWEEVKSRTGKIIDGHFIKDNDEI